MQLLCSCNSTARSVRAVCFNFVAVVLVLVLVLFKLLFAVCSYCMYGCMCRSFLLSTRALFLSFLLTLWEGYFCAAIFERAAACWPGVLAI